MPHLLPGPQDHGSWQGRSRCPQVRRLQGTVLLAFSTVLLAIHPHSQMLKRIQVRLYGPALADSQLRKPLACMDFSVLGPLNISWRGIDGCPQKTASIPPNVHTQPPRKLPANRQSPQFADQLLVQKQDMKHSRP